MFVKVKKNDHRNKISRHFIRESIPNEYTPITGQNDLDVKEKKMTNENLIRYFYLSRREFFESDSFLPQPL